MLFGTPDTPVNLENGKVIHLRRADMLHGETGGNKWFKLRKNIEIMQGNGQTGLVTFGGPHSNHIAAVAAAGRKFGFSTTGIIRSGENMNNAPTLLHAKANGMDLYFPRRKAYDEMKSAQFRIAEYIGRDDLYFLPEGGSNLPGAMGCMEMIGAGERFDLICCPAGTGTTLAGLILKAIPNQRILGFSAVKDVSSIYENIKSLLSQYDGLHRTGFSKRKNWEILPETEFGGFAKMDSRLFEYIGQFRDEHKVQLDYIYNGKMMYRIEKELYGQNILAIHTGGTQGNPAMERRWGKYLISQ